MLVVISNTRNLPQMSSSAIVDLIALMPTSKEQSTPEVIENVGSPQEAVDLMESPSVATQQRMSSASNFSSFLSLLFLFY